MIFFGKINLRRGMSTHANDPSKGWLLSVLYVVTLAVFAVLCAPVLGSATTCEGMRVLSDELTPAEVEAYCRYAVQERQKVDAFWGRHGVNPFGFTSVVRIA
jgi:hypothetical protein